MSCSENTNVDAADPLETLDDAVAAAAFRVWCGTCGIGTMRRTSS